MPYAQTRSREIFSPGSRSEPGASLCACDTLTHMVKTKTNTNRSTYVWNTRVMELAKRVGDDIRSRENNERAGSTAINTIT